MKDKKEKVVVGMSGGVDSSVAAYLLKKQGYDVIGATMEIWQDKSCLMENKASYCEFNAIEDAKKVASILGIPHYAMNFKKEFKEKVIDYFVSEYLKARTPNPCIACNRFIKWEAFLEQSLKIGATYIATGHYAGIKKLDNGRLTIKKSVDLEKDQTYALYNLTQFQLAHTLLPLYKYTKKEIREIAVKLKLPVANKRDSQEICFAQDSDYPNFIIDYLKKKKGSPQLKPGNFVDSKGNILGKHKGLIHYTVGQRKGLNIATGHPIFVLELRAKTNEVVVGDKEETQSNYLYANNLNFMAIPDLKEELRAFAKIRYGHKGANCAIKKTGEDEALCVFDEPQEAIAPGQAVVFYSKDYILLGGTIKHKKNLQ